MGAAAGGSGQDSSATDRAAANAKGKWTECPAFGIGSQYALTVRSTSDACLEDAYGTKPIKLEYLSSAMLPVQTTHATPAPAQPVTPAGQARVHVTSSPSGGEIYVDGKFFGNTPSDITLAAGEHVVKVTIGGKEWSRTVQITTGEVRIHAEMVEK
jgi:PEGA domain